MPADRRANEDRGSWDPRDTPLWALPLALLTGFWLWLAFSSGGYATRDWAVPAIALGILGLIVAALVILPRRPRQLSLAVVVPFTAYALWVLASTLWSESTDGAWQAAGRTFLYLLVLTLALSFFTSSQARRAFRYLLMAGVFALLAGCIWRLWTAPDLATLFPGGRFVFPVGHPNAAAALFLVPFWPLIWLAAGPEERAPVRGVAVGLATGLVGLALTTQSRGAVWSLGITLVLFFALSPGRVRLLFYLVVPGLLMVYAFPVLNSYWTLGTETLSGGSAARTLTVAILAAGFIGMIAALLEKWVTVSGRMKAIFGVVVLAGCAAGLIYGSITLTRDAGGPVAWFGERWQQLAGEPATDTAPTVGATGGTTAVATRADAWETAWQDLQSDLGFGSGADEGDPVGGGATGDSSQAQAGSLVLGVLGKTGVVGGVLAFAALLLSVIGILWPRTAAGWRAVKGAVRRTAGPGATRWGRRPSDYGWEMALLVGSAYWFVHANLEPLWQMTGVTLPVVLMLAAALAATDARARTMWPRLGRRLRHKPTVQAAAVSPPPDATPVPLDDTPSAAGLVRRFRLRALLPEGPLSTAFRVGLIVLSAATVILAVSAYLLALL